MRAHSTPCGHIYNPKFTTTSEENERILKTRNEIRDLILLDFDLFKHVLNHSAENYLKRIQPEFFRSGGKKHAMKLQTNLQQATDFLILSFTQNQTLAHDSENEDSFIHYLYRGICNTYYLDKSVYFNPYPSSFLSNVIYDLVDKIRALPVSSATKLPEPIAQIVASYL